MPLKCPDEAFWQRLAEAKDLVAKYRELHARMKEMKVRLKQRSGPRNLEWLLELAKQYPPPPEYFEGEVEFPFVLIDPNVEFKEKDLVVDDEEVPRREL